MFKWQQVEIKGDKFGDVYLDGYFDDITAQRTVFFTTPLDGESIDLTIYEIVDGETGLRVEPSAEFVAICNDRIKKCRSDIRDRVNDALARYED